MLIKSRPNHSFTNSQGKKIYCWENKDEIVLSLNRIDEEEGKYKKISKQDTFSIAEVFTKLGLSKDDYSKVSTVQKKVIKEEKSSGLFKEGLSLSEARRAQQEYAIRATKGGVSKNNSTMDMTTLAVLAGSVDHYTAQNSKIIRESQQAQENYIESKYEQDFDTAAIFNPSKKIDKDSVNKKFFGEKGYEKIKAESKKLELKEGSSDRVILAKTSLNPQPNGLYEIKIENIPGEEGFHADLYKAVATFIDDKLEDLKQRNADVASYEQSTEGELRGTESKGGESGGGGEEEDLDLGFEEPPSEMADAAGAAVDGMSPEVSPESMETPAI